MENSNVQEAFASVKKRKIEDTIVLDGRRFRLHKFDPLIGNYILMQIVTMVLPMGLGKILNNELGTEMLPDVGGDAKRISKQEFVELQRDILGSVYEELPAGETPVVRENGTYGVENLSGVIAFQLIVACLAFNYRDFFSAGLLSSLGTDSPNF